MAQKKKSASPAKNTAASSSTVTRIKATDTTAPTKTNKQPASAPAEPAGKLAKKKRTVRVKSAAKPFVATGGYFAGAWRELKQVRWPTRRATWSLTFAVIAYSAFFVLLVLLLDALFKYLFELMLGK